MNDHIKKILSNKDKNLSLLDNILIYIQKNDEIDIIDISEIIKNERTFYEELLEECKNNHLLTIENSPTVKLTEIF